MPPPGLSVLICLMKVVGGCSEGPALRALFYPKREGSPCPQMTCDMEGLSTGCPRQMVPKQCLGISEQEDLYKVMRVRM